jgi:hypothetical protein
MITPPVARQALRGFAEHDATLVQSAESDAWGSTSICIHKWYVYETTRLIFLKNTHPYKYNLVDTGL